MRVLFHALDAGVGGGQLVARYIAEHLLERGHEVGLVVASEGPLTDAFLELGARVELEELANLRRLTVVPAGARLVRNFDVLYSHTSAPGQIVCSVVARAARRPHVAHQHTLPYFAQRRVTSRAQRVLFRSLLARDRFVAVADHVADGLVIAQIPRGRIDVIPNGVLIPENLDTRAPSQLRVGMVARLDPNKGLETFVAAAKKSTADVSWTIAGSSSPFADFERRLRASAAAAGVSVVEARGTEFLAGLDVVALPSHHEGCPIALLEAMALGRPVVASDIPGVREALLPDAGLLFPYGDVAALANAVERLVHDAQLRETLGARARAIAQERYDVRLMQQRVAVVLDRAVTG